MDLGLKDRVAIIGGSSRGIGRAIALALAREGARVAISGRAEADLRQAEIDLARLGSQHNVLAIPADLSLARNARRVVRDTFNRFDHIDILVTHMGYGSMGPAAEFHDDTISTAIEQNFSTTLLMTREAVHYMKQQHWGRVIHVFSTQVVQPAAGMALPSTSQLALMGYTKLLANELAPFNITINSVLCGPIDTQFLEAFLEVRAQELGRSYQEMLQQTLAEIPMRRLGKPEEVGDLIAFLASERSGYLTGAKVTIDGGQLQSITG